MPSLLHNLVPDHLAPKTRRIFLEDFALPVDIGFHDVEIGAPQTITVNLEIWVEERYFPTNDHVPNAWDYDFLRSEITKLTANRRFNLQETFLREIYDLVAARAGVKALRISTRKPDVYPDCKAVGVELSSF